MVTGGSNTDDHYWYLTGWPWQYSHSWTVANDLYTFQMWHWPGGYLKGTALGSSNYSWDSISAGDLVFYDFDGNGSKDHVAIQVAKGYDPVSGYYGDLVDAHTNDHYHGFWSLLPYNSQWRTTTIYLVPISTGN